MESSGRPKQNREITGGSNLECMPLEQHFGLTKMRKVEGVEVRWPSGSKQRFTDIPAIKTLEIAEGVAAWRELYATAGETPG
jgi:hypothetical protein